MNITLLKGKLTYILSGIAVLFGVAAYLTGQWVSQTEAIGIVWTGLATFGIRRSIGSSGVPPQV